ncbi:MAG TPA: ECF transporter S component [Clostridia bacterium]|nr:ECF transporter S component [Clostridia bacterium]
MKARELALGGLLTAFSLLIPLALGPYLRVIVGPFSATVASHVPLFLGALISPLVAAIVGAASAFGFLLTMGPVIAARAASHVVVGLVAGLVLQRQKPFYLAILVSLPVHAGLEALIVIPFGFSVYDWGLVVGVGTGLHHLVDGALTLAVIRLLGLDRLQDRAAAA